MIMATFVNDITQSPDVRCDEHSAFDAEGFTTPGRAWWPRYGAPCVECGEDC